MQNTNTKHKPTGEVPTDKRKEQVLEDYLRETHRLQLKTIKAYRRYLEVFFTWVVHHGREIKEITYSDLLEYLKERKGSHSYRVSQLSAIRYYYRYLKHLGEIEKNPASGLFLKGRKNTVPHDLLTAEQLEELYENYQEKGLSGKRNKAMLGLLVFQGVSSGDLARLEPCHLKLREGKIEIPGSRVANSRILKLEASQIIDLQEALQVRRKMQEVTGKETDGLFINLEEKDKLRNSLDKIMSTLRKSLGEFKDFTQLRQSRISLWVKQYDIRQVQYMAGHKYVSSTERYQSTNLEELQKELEKHHPGNCRTLKNI